MKRSILILVILMSSFLIPQAQAEIGKLEPIDDSSPLIQAVRAHLKAYQDNDQNSLLGRQTKLLNEITQEVSAQPTQRMNALIGSAQLKGVRFITNDRAWVEASIPEQPDFTGFYFIKEDGVWKSAHLKWYNWKVHKDLDSIVKAIGDYNNDNEKLPQTLNDLLAKPYIVNIPVDPYNENGAPYVYKVISKNNCRIYSIGPDSKDDGGEKEYEETKKNPPPLSEGDIIKQYSGMNE
ncbi:MAG: type II secretion system protein GspG [Candidatus Omnitrophica bacterium]|nr:type II secretion system protein GspG [Candidatus Omnitrophota bacterium]MDD5553789.1 type II secretion system protein GspG [Candidatus Omnitrophota bacterium]